jgi:DtxR family Mn-dependent transcriptional regulator
MEHAVCADFENRLREKLGEGESCPHGNRVAMDRPQDRRARGWKPLDEISGSGPAQVTSVFERDRRLLEYLDGLGIRPGAKLRMISRNYDETLTLKVGGKSVQLGRPAATKVWITQAPAP